MSSDSLIRALPDLVVAVRRDGVILALNSGYISGPLRLPSESIGQQLGEVWPEAVASLIKQLTRKAISTRATAESKFKQDGQDYEARASAQGPDKAICVIRLVASDALADTVAGTAERLAPQIDRRGFLKRFKESVSVAALREKALGLAVIHLEGLADIAQAIAPKVSEQLMTTAVLRLGAGPVDTEVAQPVWYLGQLSDSLLALVVESSDRAQIESSVWRVCHSLREPVQLAGDSFQLTPSAGIAILGQDGSSARGLLDHARSAANEARRNGGGRVCFFTDTLRLKSLARMDIARELHDAIDNREIQLRYVSRHELTTGRPVALAGYLRWQHPLRGEIKPADFLKVAETTGLGTRLSRAAMQWLQEDFRAMSAEWGDDVRISFGALRHHLAHEEFVSDFQQLLANGAIPASRLELRISERNMGVRPATDFRPLAAAGVQLIVDEVGRGPLAMEWLARAPLQALQLDRAMVLAAASDEVALKICRASAATAAALGLITIAPGVDDNDQRRLMAKIGCKQAFGDFFKQSAVTETRVAGREQSR